MIKIKAKEWKDKIKVDEEKCKVRWIGIYQMKEKRKAEECGERRVK